MKDGQELPQSQKIYSEYMKKAGITDKVKIVTVPMKQNKILLRIQNLADIFDQDSTTSKVNLTMVIEGMWKSSHALDSEVMPYTLTETSVTGNMPVSEMQSRRLKWKTEDDAILPASKLSYSINGDLIDVEPMRIRVFTLEFDQI
jgi:hypothetical protein